MNVPPISLKSRIVDKSLEHLKKVNNSFKFLRFQAQALIIINKLVQEVTTFLQNIPTTEVQRFLQEKDSNQSTEALVLVQVHVIFYLKIQTNLSQ